LPPLIPAKAKAGIQHDPQIARAELVAAFVAGMSESML
jgi:hypothetical protein